MRSVLTTALVLGVLAGTSLNASAADKGSVASGDVSAAQPAAADKHWEMLDKYCVECHNYEDWKGQIAFDTMTPDSIPQDAEIWEKAINRLSGDLMPPPGKPRPDEARRVLDDEPAPAG